MSTSTKVKLPFIVIGNDGNIIPKKAGAERLVNYTMYNREEVTRSLTYVNVGENWEIDGCLLAQEALRKIGRTQKWSTKLVFCDGDDHLIETMTLSHEDLTKLKNMVKGVKNKYRKKGLRSNKPTYTQVMA